MAANENLNDRRIADSSKNLSDFCKTIKWMHITLPAIFAVSVFIYTLITSDFTISFGLFCIIFVGCLTIITSILSYHVSKEESIFIGEAIELREKRIEISKLHSYIEKLGDYTDNEIEQSNNFVIFLANSFPYINKVIIEREDFYSNFSAMMDQLYSLLEYIYKDPQNQLFTIALYLYDTGEPSNYKLKPFYSKKPDIMNKGQGRWWKPGQGHIGISYHSKEQYNHSNIHEITPNTMNTRENDKTNYVSAISIPIALNPNSPIDDRIIRGVFCITSNLEGEFQVSEDNSYHTITSFKIRENCAKTIARLIELLFNIRYGNEFNHQPFLDLPQEIINKINEETVT